MQLLPHEHGFDQPLGLLSDCHRRVERFLTILDRVGKESPDDSLPDQYREGLNTALNYFRDAAPKHTRDEEDSLFPRIQHSSEAKAIMERLESEHQFADLFHAELEEMGRRWLTQGALAPRSRRRFCECTEKLLKLYAEHIRVEDEELFPLAATLLSPDAIAAIGREMAARRGLKGQVDP